MTDNRVTLKAARVHVNLTQAEAAKKLEICESSVFNYERGKTVPPIDVVQKMSALYGRSIENIIWPSKQ